MKLITERTQIQDIAARWRAQYPRDRQEIAQKLDALDENSTADDVAAIIGNRTWCQPSTCNDCGAVADVAVQVGEEPDYESRTATLCLACVEKALSLMRPNASFSRGPSGPSAGSDS